MFVKMEITRAEMPRVTNVENESLLKTKPRISIKRIEIDKMDSGRMFPKSESMPRKFSCKD